jgi:hypothetical protein
MNGNDDPTGQDSVVQELQTQRLRTAVAVEVSPRLWEYFDEVHPIAVVVDDIVDRWITGTPDQIPLIGPSGFTTAYLAAVEEDAAGRPWWQMCRLGAARRPVADETYAKRVWTYHAGWLRRLHPADAVSVPDPLPEGLAGELITERLCTEAAIDVAAAVYEWLGNDPARIGAVAADVVVRWLALPATERAGIALTGMNQYAQRYVAAVLYADPAEDRFRPEFCPPDGQPFDWHAYTRAVWTHHLDHLVGAR